MNRYILYYFGNIDMNFSLEGDKCMNTFAAVRFKDREIIHHSNANIQNQFSSLKNIPG